MRLLKPSLTSFLRQKKLILYIISMVMTITALISIIYITYCINITYENKVKNNIVNRVLYVSKSDYVDLENDIKQISNISNIDYVYKTISPISVLINNQYSCTIKTGAKEEFPESIIGNILSINNSSEVEVLLPDKILDSNNRIIYGKDYLEKNIDITYNTYKISAKVVGVYLDTKNQNILYMTQKSMENFTEYDMDLIKNNSYFAIVNDYENVDSVIEGLLQNGYISNLFNESGQADVKLYKTASIVITALIYIILIFNYILIGTIIANIVSDEKTDIALLKAIGYNIKDLSQIMLYRILIIICCSYCFGILLSLGLNKILNDIIINKFSLEIQYSFITYIKISLVFLIILFAISVVSVNINSRKIKNISAIDLLKDK